MGFRDFPMPATSRSYVNSTEFLSYLLSYAEHFDLVKLIKFRQHVIRVRPVDKTKWEVSSFKFFFRCSTNDVNDGFIYCLLIPVDCERFIIE